MKRSKFLIMLLAFMLTSMTSLAQKRTFTGTVVDNTGETVIGASVVQKGTSNGSQTDLDGNFSISVEPGATLTVSYIGYQPQEVRVADGMRIVLQPDDQLLNEIVVIGYGVQKKSVVTASIAKVSAEDLAGKAPVRMDNALKGLAAGVNVTSSNGAPGSAPRVRVRGTGSINNTEPLYIVDGMPIEGDLDFVNPNDIESIEVLKDAASGAIYGARAANGVVLVTTKKGKMGKPTLSYNFSRGWQTKWRKRDVTGATDYAILTNERLVNSGQAPIYLDPYHLVDANGNEVKGFGTDWQDEVFNDNAPVVNHDVTLSGATERVNYYVSTGYFSQDGIVGGNWGKSNYERFTLRSNTIINILDATKERSFLNKLDFTADIAYMRTKSTNIGGQSSTGSVLGSALYLSPELPVTLTGDVAEGQRAWQPNYELLTDANGNPYTIPNYVGNYGEMNNPVAMLAVPSQPGWLHKFVPKFAFDFQLYEGLKYHFTYSADLAFWGYNSATLSKYYLSGNNKQEHTSASSGQSRNTNWQVENTLSYDKTFGLHTVGIVLGQSAHKRKGDGVSAWAWNLRNTEKPSVNYTDSDPDYALDADGNITGVTIQRGGNAGPWTEYRMSSYFGRVSYNYDERYMLQATLRRDGSSKFGPNNKYGTFPSFSLGWNVTNESFFQDIKEKARLANLKLRFSWGKNGYDNIGDFLYTVYTAQGNNVLLGKTATKFSGSKADGTANPDIKWEESEQTDLGLDLGFFNNALTFTVDYYIKKTNGMLMTMPIPSYVGESKPTGNVGDMENKGVEFELGYKWNIGDATFNVKGNASYVKNTLKNLGNDTGFMPLDGMQGIPGQDGGLARAENGKPFPFFYGYTTAGIFQNWDEVNNYTWTNPETGEKQLIQPDARPGFTRFVDLNNDGVIDTNDMSDIGNGTPDWTFGLNLNAEWKGFDFNLFLQGVTGNKILDATHRSGYLAFNYPTYMLDRWTGEGTSNEYPMMSLLDEDANWRISDLYIHDGSYCRIKNISLGYTLPKSITRLATIERLRFYVMAENLVTWTKYCGFDPELGDGTTSLGIDKGVYPQARTWTVGVNLTF